MLLPVYEPEYGSRTGLQFRTWADTIPTLYDHSTIPDCIVTYRRSGVLIPATQQIRLDSSDMVTH